MRQATELPELAFREERGGGVMEQEMVAKVALAAATYAIDRPYSYKIPAELEGRIQPGMRVMVPFGRSNRHPGRNGDLATLGQLLCTRQPIGRCPNLFE